VLVQIIIGGLMIGSIYGLLALGYSLIYKATGLMTFCQGELFMIGGFLGLTFYKLLKLPFFISLLFTIIIMFIIGILIERFIIRVLLKKGANLICIVLATIGLSIILKNIAMLIWGSRCFQFPQIFSFDFIKIGNIKIVPEAFFALVISLISMLLLHFFMMKTKFGTSMRASAEDVMAAKTMGINVNLTVAITWGLSSALAGTAGMLIGPIYGVIFTMGDMIGLKGFAGAVIGGYGNMYGSIFGSLIIGVVETFAAGYVSSLYKDFIAFSLLIIVLVIKPTGLFKSDVYSL